MTWTVTIENVAGIREGEATLRPGTNAVRASNWQGKSSFLAALKTAMGTATPLTEGQDRGRVVLETDDRTVTVDLHRRDGRVVAEGTPYLADEYDRICASLFAFLDEGNEIRRAVRNGENLEAALTRPLDFENIDEQIADLRAERDTVDAELSRAEEAAGRLASLESEITSRESTLDDLRETRADLVDAAAPENETREELSSLRAERERLDSRIQRLERTLESTQERLEERREELADLDAPDADDVADELATERESLRALERDVELLQSVYEANKRVVDEGRMELLTDVTHDLLADTATCWVCGDETTRDDIETRLAELGERIGDLRAEAETHRERVDDLEARRDEAKRARRRRADLETECRELREAVNERTESLESARERRAEVDARLDDLTAEVRETDDELTDVESEIKYTEAELADLREDLDAAETQAAQRETLEAERERLTEELTDLRTRKETVKRRTREAFAETMSEIIAQFETGFEAARLTADFELVVARGGREASLDALSEGEVELLGLVAALAGHEAFDVAERVPLLTLDGLGGIAADNLATLVDELRERADYLVLTAYPEHTSFDGAELDPSTWTVVSDGDGLEQPT